MPYKKPYRGRRRRRNYTRYKKRMPQRVSYWSTAKQLWKDVTYLKSLINTEFKYKDTSANSAISTSPNFQLLNGLARGDDSTDRDGRQVRIKSLQSNFLFTQHASATSTIVRCIFFIDKDANGATPNMTDVFEAATINAPRELDNRKRFVILKDWTVTLTSSGQTIKRQKVFKNLDMKTVYDDSTAGDITDISSNSLFLLLLSNEATNTPTVNSYVRIRFVDN